MVSQSLKRVTGYAVLQEMVEVVQTEIANIRGMQRQRLGPGRGGESRDLCKEVKSLVMSAQALQAEIRKTGDDADRAVDKLPPEKQLELVLAVIGDMSPEHRVVVQLFLEEKGAKLLG